MTSTPPTRWTAFVCSKGILFRRGYAIGYHADDPNARRISESFAQCKDDPDSLNAFFRKALEQGYCSEAVGQHSYKLYPATTPEPAEPEDAPASWIDRHSVDCYFCSKLFDERDGSPADDWNGRDGGTICPECLKKKEAELEAAAAQSADQAQGQELPEDFESPPKKDKP